MTTRPSPGFGHGSIPPVDSVILVVLAILAVGGGVVALVRFAGRAGRRRALVAFAERHGLTFSRRDPFALLHLGFQHFTDPPGRPGRPGGPARRSTLAIVVSTIRMFNRMSASRLENVMTGSWKGLPVRCADHTERRAFGIRSMLLLPSARRFSLVIADIGMMLPPIVIRAERLSDRLVDDLTFESGEFNRRFEVRCQDREFAYALVDARMMRWLLEANEGCSFEILGGRLLASCGLLPPSRVESVLDAAVEFSGRIPRVIAARYGT